MTVSFIIIAYNAQNSINSLLDNLKEQTYLHEKIEVILVDSASTDDTKKRMQDFAKDTDFERVVVLDNFKRTLPCGWNVALDAAKNDIILRVDAHATIEKDFIEQNVKTIANGEDICGGNVTSIMVNETNWSNTVNDAENSMFGGSFAAFRRANTAKYVSTVAFGAYKKSVFDKVGRYNEALARTEDNEMHYRMKQAGYKFFYNPDIKSYRETRPSFKKLLKQKYLNGYWIGLTLSVCPKCFSLYHLVPFGFILGIILTTILALFGIWQLSALMWGAYFLFDIINSIMCFVGGKFNLSKLLLPILFLILHLAYGLGTLIGIIKIPFFKKSNS